MQNLNRLFHFFPLGILQKHPKTWTTVQTVQIDVGASRESVRSIESLTSDEIFNLFRSKLPNSTEWTFDSKEQIDYVLVVKKKTLDDSESASKILNFLNALQETGVVVHMGYGKAYSNFLFVRLHLPDTLLIQLAISYHLEFSYMNPNYSPEKKPYFKLFQTELDLKYESTFLHRAPETILDLRPTRPTNAERSMLLYMLMTKTFFDSNIEDYRIEQMLHRGLLEAAYPPHEGDYLWTKEGPLNDRQLLAKCWGSILCVYKKQPLNLVEKYFGTEMALYFAYLDFYFKYMIPAALIGLGFYFLGLFSTQAAGYLLIVNEICGSDIRLCPFCNDRTLCKYSNFSDHCDVELARATLDNVFSTFFAMFMSVWAIFFVFSWKRRLNILRMRWNVFKVRLEKGIRPEFLASATKTRINTATGEKEPYIPRRERCRTLSCTYTVTALIAAALMLFAMAIVAYQNRLAYVIAATEDKRRKRKAQMTQVIVKALMILLQIYIFSPTFPKIAFELTKKETQSTQYGFDNSYIAKYCIFMFANCFSAITYLAFIKGRLYDHPGTVHKFSIVKAVVYDLCSPTGCFTDIGFTVGAIVCASSLKSALKQTLKPMIKVFVNKRMNKLHKKELPQWEVDFALLSTGKYYLLEDYFDLLVQYGYIVCFISSFPLAPLFAVIRNAFQIRIDARRYLIYSRRCTPKKVRGLGTYNKLINWTTYIGVFANGCVIAFSSSFISWFLYTVCFRTEGGYYKFMLSEFDTADLPRKIPEDNGTCFYPGIRHPPQSTQKYELKTEFYIILVGQLMFLLVYEQALVFLRSLLRTSLKERPKVVREKVLHQEELMQEARQKILNDFYKDAYAKKFTDNIHIPPQ